jgi:multiple sugar transport system ATP-binding protein
VLYDKPKNVFVAGFIGSPAMNIKTVKLGDAGAHLGGLQVPLSREAVAAAGEGADGKVTVGFRPEDVQLVGQGDGGLSMTVDLVEELGSDAYVYGRADLDGTEEQFVIRTEGRNTPNMGDTVYLKPQSTPHIFNASTGDRVEV